MVEFQSKELKKRTRCIRVFPNKESLLRIATALLIELDEKWLANGQVYLKGRRQGFGKFTEKTLRSLEVSIYEYEKFKKEYPLDINAANRGFFEEYPPPRTDILKPNQRDSIGFVGKTPVGMFL